MLKTVDFCYFSPTGGTKKAGEILAFGLAETVNEINLAEKREIHISNDVVIVAAPVFAGRIPALVSDKISKLNGKGRKAVTAVVYGVRAYDDALLELNDAMRNSGFEIVASAALVAQHSMVPEVGTGRPDKADMAEIQKFAADVVHIIENNSAGYVTVPGNFPYREGMKTSATPVSLPECVACGRCAAICPTEAITIGSDGVATDIGKCIMCMACTANCHINARILPSQIKDGLAQRLSAFRDVRRENSFF